MAEKNTKAVKKRYTLTNMLLLVGLKADSVMYGQKLKKEKMIRNTQ